MNNTIKIILALPIVFVVIPFVIVGSTEYEFTFEIFDLWILGTIIIYISGYIALIIKQIWLRISIPIIFFVLSSIIIFLFGVLFAFIECEEIDKKWNDKGYEIAKCHEACWAGPGGGTYYKLSKKAYFGIIKKKKEVYFVEDGAKKVENNKNYCEINFQDSKMKFDLCKEELIVLVTP